jgi:hypothetical protein
LVTRKKKKLFVSWNLIDVWKDGYVTIFAISVATRMQLPFLAKVLGLQVCNTIFYHLIPKVLKHSVA